MVEKYQLDNPNNCRIFIDYRKDKDKVKFDYVANDSIYQIAHSTYLGLVFYKIPYCFVFWALISLWVISKSVDIAILIMLVYSIVVYLIPLMTMRSKKLQRLLPILNTLGTIRFSAEFKPRDVKNKRIEIPLFRNILLDYTANGEMSKYLERVEIIEHPFNFIMGRKKERNQYLWKATFYFSNKPTTGNLEVKFR